MAVESRGPEIEGIAYGSVILSSIATLLRVYCRAWVLKAFSVDDWLAVIAQVRLKLPLSTSACLANLVDTFYRLLRLLYCRRPSRNRKACGRYSARPNSQDSTGK